MCARAFVGMAGRKVKGAAGKGLKVVAVARKAARCVRLAQRRAHTR